MGKTKHDKTLKNFCHFEWTLLPHIGYLEGEGLLSCERLGNKYFFLKKMHLNMLNQGSGYALSSLLPVKSISNGR